MNRCIWVVGVLCWWGWHQYWCCDGFTFGINCGDGVSVPAFHACISHNLFLSCCSQSSNAQAHVSHSSQGHLDSWGCPSSSMGCSGFTVLCLCGYEQMQSCTNWWHALQRSGWLFIVSSLALRHSPSHIGNLCLRHKPCQSCTSADHAIQTPDV